MSIKNKLSTLLKRFIVATVAEKSVELNNLKSVFYNSFKGINVKLYPKYKIINTTIGDYTFIAESSIISHTSIGKFCSIGPNLVCGWGIHPTSTLSTAPMFYSTLKQNGLTLSKMDKIKERSNITIGNDVFIGMNVSVLDGVNIGDGAIIGAGAVVSKDIPPYAIAVGCPIKIIKYRFQPDQIQALLQIKWWNWAKNDLFKVENEFFDVKNFIEKYSTKLQ